MQLLSEAKVQLRSQYTHGLAVALEQNSPTLPRPRQQPCLGLLSGQLVTMSLLRTWILPMCRSTRGPEADLAQRFQIRQRCRPVLDEGWRLRRLAMQLLLRMQPRHTLPRIHGRPGRLGQRFQIRARFQVVSATGLPLRLRQTLLRWLLLPRHTFLRFPGQAVGLAQSFLIQRRFQPQVEMPWPLAPAMTQ